MSPADRAWAALAVGVAAWDITCQPGETLSDAVGRYHRKHPWLTRIVTVYLAAHLLDVIPQRLDILHTATRLHP